MADKINIPARFKKLIEDYGFEDTKLLDKAVATRSSEDWFAILFHDAEGDEYFAVDFCYAGGGTGQFGLLKIDRVDGWEIQNDYVGPFESIKEFKNEKLTLRFF